MKILNIKKIIFLFFILIWSIWNTHAWLWLFADNWDIISVSRWNDMIIKLHTKLDQSNVTGTWNIAVMNSGTWVLISLTGAILSNPIPDITTTTQSIVSTSSTSLISLNWDDFIPTSVVTIPWFPWTINSSSILSQSKININITTTSATGTYDFVVSNNWVLNTLWAWNWVALLKVQWIINIVWDDTIWRKYTDSSYAISCNWYKNPTSPFVYAWDTGDGQYWIKPDANPAFKVYCDMTTSGWWWTRVEYTNDLPHQAQFAWWDANRWLTSDFSLTLSDTRINAIRSVSSEGKQTYHWTCQWVIHYLYQASNYAYAFGFRFHQGHETVHNQQTYPSTTITVSTDGCLANNNTLSFTDFDIVDIRVPVINVHSRDNSSTEQFGSPLTSYPAWLR